MQQFNVENFKKNPPTTNSNSSSFKWYKLKPNSNFFKILPPWSEIANGLPWYEVTVHYIKDPENKTHTFRCSRKSENFCAICDQYFKLLDSIKRNSNEKENWPIY